MLNNENLTYLRNSLHAERERLSAIINSAPPVLLICRTRGQEKKEFYIRDLQNSSKQTYVNSELIPTARLAAQRMFAQAKIDRLNKTIKGLDMLIDINSSDSPEDLLLQKKPWLMDFLHPIISNNKRLEQWKALDYERNREHPENLIHNSCVPGLVVRSKSEGDIVSRLELFGVPYHYDEVMLINGVRISMDFVCLNVNSGKKWYWDHRGMLDDPSYIEKTLFCERQFLNAGIIHGINLIVTSETSTHPLSIQTIDEEIKRYLL